MNDEESLPPIPTKVRLNARYRAAPRARKDISLGLFIALILIIAALGWQGIRNIGVFLQVMNQRYSHPSPSPTPGIEIRFEPSGPK